MIDLAKLETAIRWANVTSAEQDVVRSAGYAVLEAKRIWWCARTQRTYKTRRCLEGSHGEECSWVKMVPVKGES